MITDHYRAPAKETGGIRFDGDGGVTIVTGEKDWGQGHRTPFAQLLQDRRGIPMECPCSRAIPMMVEGQVHGGVAQGSGQVLMQRIAYPDDGQLVTRSDMEDAHRTCR